MPNQCASECRAAMPPTPVGRRPPGRRRSRRGAAGGDRRSWAADRRRSVPCPVSTSRPAASIVATSDGVRRTAIHPDCSSGTDGVEHVDDLAGARCDHDRLDARPAVDPLDAREEGLATERGERAREAARPHAERDERGAAVRRFDEVRVADVLHRTRGAARGQDRVAREPLEGTVRRGAARDGHRVTALGAALGDQQIPVVAAAVEVRTLGSMQAGARPQRPRRTRAPRRSRGRPAPGGCPDPSRRR